MGNAVCIFHFPNNLRVTDPYFYWGKETVREPGTLRIEKISGLAEGVQAIITFKRDVSETTWSYEKTSTSGYQASGSVGANSRDAAEAKIAVELGTTSSEVRKWNMDHKIIIRETVEYSELTVDNCYLGSNKGSLKWNKNDLNLKHTIRWEPESVMIVTISEK